MDTIYRAPVHTSFATVVSGLITLRAYKKIGYFKIDFSRNMEKGADVIFCNIATQRWLGIRIDVVIFIFGATTAIMSVFYKGSIEPQMIAFSLQSITDMMPLVSIVVRLYSEFENFMTSSQSIYGYTKLPSEGNLIEDKDADLGENWPQKGSIEFKNVTMSYRPGLEPCLRKLSFKAQPGMKIGIVGRTGAGKSSILQALFRLCDLSEGSMLIDDYDCKLLGLHTLRKNISFIPQSPFLL